jgi:integrase
MDAIRRELRDNTYTVTNDVTAREFFEDEWLPAVRGSIEPSTHYSYQRNLALHVLPYLGSLRLVDVSPARLNKLYADLADGKRRDGKSGGLSTATRRNVHAIVRKAFADAVRWGRLARNPADLADPPKAAGARAPEMRTWSFEQLGRFLEVVEGDRYYAPWFFLATTGARRGECLGLRWRDVDLDAGRVSIRQTVTAVQHKVHIAPRTKTGRARVINLDSPTVVVLQAWRARQREEMFAFGRRPDDDTLLFSWPDDGRPYHPERFSREFDRRLERLRFEPRIRLHDLRHTWASLALAADVPVKIVSERLGHAKTAITSDLYQHVTPGMQHDAAEKVAGLIFRPGDRI